jgi:hypothetical protein
MTSKLEGMSPVRREDTRMLGADYRRVGRTTLFGTILTADAQGSLAAVGYGITGVP